jgi:hypothetical protein
VKIKFGLIAEKEEKYHLRGEEREKKRGFGPIC